MADPTRVRNRDSHSAGPGSTGVNWRLWTFAIAVVLLAIIVLQNSESVRFKLLFIVDTEMPLIIGLLIAGVLGAVIGYAGPVLLRHRRDERRRDQER